MGEQQVTYAKRQETIRNFFATQEKGSYYLALVNHLKKTGIEVPEDDSLFIGGPLGKLYQEEKLIKVLVSEVVFEKWYGVKWEGEKEKGKCKTYFDPTYRSSIEQVEALQRQEEISIDAAKGVTPLLRARIVDTRLFDIVQELAREGGYLDEVLLSKLKQYELGLRKLGDEAEQIIENMVVDFTKRVYAEHSKIMTLLEEARKRVETSRKKAYQGTASTNS
jgi:hypothetical protein